MANIIIYLPFYYVKTSMSIGLKKINGFMQNKNVF